MKNLRNAALCCVALTPFVAFGLWVLWPDVSGRSEMWMGTRAIRSYHAGDRITVEKSFMADTFTNECSSLKIRSFYERAAAALAEKSQDTKTYLWSDRLGWERVSSVLQTADGYIEVRASRNNDNDSVVINFSPGLFGKSESDLLESFALPGGILRDEREWD